MKVSGLKILRFLRKDSTTDANEYPEDRKGAVQKPVFKIWKI